MKENGNKLSGSSFNEKNNFNDLGRLRDLKENEYLSTREGVEYVSNYYESLFPPCKDSSLWADKLPKEKMRAIRAFEENPPEFALDKGPNAALLEGLVAQALLDKTWIISPFSDHPEVQRTHEWDDYNHHVDCVVSVPMPDFSPYFGLDVTTDGGKPGDKCDKISEKIAKCDNGYTPKNPFEEPNFFGFTRVDLYGPTQKNGLPVPERPVKHIPRFVLGLSSDEVTEALNDPEATQIKWPGHLAVPESIVLSPNSDKHRKITFKILSEIDAQASLFQMMLPKQWLGHEQELAEAKQNLSIIQDVTFQRLGSFFIDEPKAEQLRREGKNEELIKYLKNRIYNAQANLVQEERGQLARQGSGNPETHKPPFTEILTAAWGYKKGFIKAPQVKQSYSNPKIRNDPAYLSQIFKTTHSFSPN